MYTSTKSQRGFTMVEMVFSIVILSTVLLFVVRTFAPAATFTADSRSVSNLERYLQDQTEFIKSIGFWVWSGDTNNANNAQHPVEIWKTRLTTLGYTGRAKIDTLFLKASGNDLVSFSGEAAFDGNEARNKIQVTLTLYTSSGAEVSESFYLIQRPSTQNCWAAITIIKQALAMYAEDNAGAYPATGSLASGLVSTYLDEIPNDPFTEEQDKTTHTEEIIDWFYENNGGTITLAPHSHRSSINSTF